MTLLAFFLILVSAFLHAGWNILSKKQIPSLSFFAVMHVTATLLFLPFFLVENLPLGKMPINFWPILVCSQICEFIATYGLVTAYRKEDICLVYPLSRALPVLLTAAITLLARIGISPGPLSLAGMVILSFGCLLMPLMHWDQFHLDSYRSSALKFILLTAIGITGYTIFDSMAIRLILNNIEKQGIICSSAYLFLVEAGLALMLFFSVACSKIERQEFRKIFLKTKKPIIAGFFSATSYVMVLVAMGYVTNVSIIQAFRQMSLPIGVLAGIFLLHEKPGCPRLIGIALVVIGLIIVALGN